MISLRTRGSLVVLLATLMISCLAFGATEDIIHMDDGRVLHGQIIKETDSTIVFDRFNPDLGISVTITLPKSKILRVERDVETDGEETTPAGSPSDAGEEPARISTSTPVSLEESSEDVASLYIVQLKGDVGADFHAGVYTEAIEEINSLRPDVVIYELDSMAIGRSMLSWWMGATANEEGNWWERDPKDQSERINLVVKDIEDMLKNFHYKVSPAVRQVVWAKDASGAATILALGWEEMYMHPDARLGTLGLLWLWTQGFDDDDVRSKMEQAQLGAVLALTQFGKHDPAFVEGLLNPAVPLSFSCKGRKAVWYNLYSLGDIPVHQDGKGFNSDIRQYYAETQGGDKVPLGLEFDARPSEELLISDGTAETLQELAMLLGYREYSVTESEVLSDIAEYKEKWRAKLDRAYDAWQDYQKYLERGTLSDLQKAKTALTRVINLVRTNHSVALRMRTIFGIDLTGLEARLMMLQSQIRQMARGGGGGAGGGGGGRGGGGGPRGP